MPAFYSRILILLALAPLPAWSQTRTREVILNPPLGSEITATAGSEIFERSARTVSTSKRIVVESDLQIKGLFSARIEQGEKLLVISPREACNAIMCLLDKDGDGRFERKKMGGALISFKVDPPIPYRPTDPLIETVGDDGFRQSLLFLGISGKTLRLAYREFSNDMARPAFSNEVKFELTGTFPETVAYRDVVMEIQGVGNTGLRYVIKKVGG